MDTVTMLRDLWRLRLCVAGVCLLAVLAGAAVLYKVSFPPQSRSYDVGTATARILVNTPSSQVVAVSPRGSELLGWQADLLASLMVDGAIKTAIAQRASLQPNQIVGVTDAVTSPSASGPAPVSAPSGPRAFVLTTHVLTDSAGNNVPIIELDAQAPNQAAAARLADAAIGGLTDYLGSQAALERVPDANRLQVTDLGVQAATETRGPSHLIAIAAVILVFGLGCASILGILALIRAFRASFPRARVDQGELLVWDVGDTPHEYLLEPVAGRHMSRAMPGTSVEPVASGSGERHSDSHGSGPSNGNGSSNGNGESGEAGRSDEHGVPVDSPQEVA
jgi:hypothetical protein